MFPCGCGKSASGAAAGGCGVFSAAGTTNEPSSFGDDGRGVPPLALEAAVGASAAAGADSVSTATANAEAAVALADAEVKEAVRKVGGCLGGSVTCILHVMKL